MSEPVLTNTPRPGDTPEQIAARTAPREHYAYTMAKLFYLTEPCRGVFVVKVQATGGAFIEFEISRDQLAQFLVDGTSMAFRSSLEETWRGR